MRKEDIAGLVVYMFIIAIAVMYGLVFLQPYYAESGFTSVGLYALYILGAIVLGIFAHSVLLEIGHVLGAKAGKYKILSVNILHFSFKRNEEDKFRFKFAEFNGLTGETKILPLKEDSNPRSYLTFGSLLSALFIGGCLAAFILLMNNTGTLKDLSRFFLTAGVVSIICLLYNILPIQLDSLTDGYRLLMVSNPINRDAFNELLRVEYEISQGKKVEIKTFTELTNFTADLNMNKVYQLVDEKKYEQAEELIELLLSQKDKLSLKLSVEVVAMKIYLKKIHGDSDALNKYIEEEIDMEFRRTLFESNTLTSLRAYLIIEGFYDNSKNECMLTLSKVGKAYKRVPKNRRAAELEKFNEIVDMISEAHPKWDIGKYKLVASQPTKKQD